MIIFWIIIVLVVIYGVVEVLEDYYEYKLKKAAIEKGTIDVKPEDLE